MMLWRSKAVGNILLDKELDGKRRITQKLCNLHLLQAPKQVLQLYSESVLTWTGEVLVTGVLELVTGTTVTEVTVVRIDADLLTTTVAILTFIVNWTIGSYKTY